MSGSGWIEDPAWRESSRVLDPQSLKGLAHPLRVRLLGVLRTDGPSTATRLADQVGESSGTTSYHLRQLERHGFVAEETGRGTGRERWWRALHRNTEVGYFEPGPDVDHELPEIRAAELVIRRAQLDQEVRAEQRWQAGYPAETAAWQQAGSASDYQLRMSADQTRELMKDLEAVVHRHRTAIEARPGPDGARPVTVIVRAIPRPDGPTATGPTAAGPTATGPTATGPTATDPTAIDTRAAAADDGSSGQVPPA